MSETERHADDLVAAYVLGAVTPAEAAMVEAHLSWCPACVQMADELRAVTYDLSAMAPLTTPSPLLKQRIMAAVRADAADAQRRHVTPAVQHRHMAHDRARAEILPAQRIAVSTSADTVLQRARTRRMAQRFAGSLVVAAAAVAAAIGIGIWHIPGFGPSGPTLVYAMDGLPAQPSIKGTLSYTADNARVELDLHGLRRLAPGHVYELWFIRGHYRLERPVLSFTPTANGQADLRLRADNPRHYTMACLSIEPSAAAHVPTMPLVALAEIDH